MIKICSLDFLDKKTFETDILSKDGAVFFKADDEVTSGKLLQLYFKEIFIGQELEEDAETEIVKDKEEAKEKEEIEVPSSISSEVDELEQSEAAAARIAAESEVAAAKMQAEEHAIAEAAEKAAEEARIKAEAEAKAEAEEEARIKAEAEAKAKAEEEARIKAEAEAKAKAEEEARIKAELEANSLKFDEEEAKNVSKYASELGKILGMDAKKIENLQQAAYYHKIGRASFTKDDLLQKDFIKRQSEESYRILLNEKGFPQEIAQVAKLYMGKYDVNSFKLNETIPYYHIVGIVSYYEDSLRKTGSKEKVLRKMLQLGGNRFNIFVLHKFINMMRNTDE